MKIPNLPSDLPFVLVVDKPQHFRFCLVNIKLALSQISQISAKII